MNMNTVTLYSPPTPDTFTGKIVIIATENPQYNIINAADAAAVLGHIVKVLTQHGTNPYDAAAVKISMTGDGKEHKHKTEHKKKCCHLAKAWTTASNVALLQAHDETNCKIVAKGKQYYIYTNEREAADHVDSMNTPREIAKREVHKIEHDLDPDQSRIMFHFQNHATIDLEELCNNVQEITGQLPVAAITTYRRGAMVTVKREHRAKALTAHNTYTKNNIEYRKVVEPEHTSADLDRAKAKLRKIDMEAQADQDLKASSTDIDYSKLMLDEETVALLKQATKLKANAIYDTERDRIKQSVEALVQPKLATENMKRYLEKIKRSSTIAEDGEDIWQPP